MGKIGDLWVRLGLKKEDYEAGLNQVENHTRNFGEKMKAMGASAKAVWAAIGVAVVKFAADAIKMTNKWGDQFNIAVQGMKAGYGAFVRGLSSGEGFNELFENIRTAVTLAREAASALDEVFERKISYGYSAAETDKEIANLQLIMRDSSKSDKEREAAAKRIIELERILGDEKKDIWNQEAIAQRNFFKSQTQMNDDEIDFMVKNYNQNRAIIADSRAYLAEKERLEKSIRQNTRRAGLEGISEGQFTAMADESRKALAELEKNTSQAVKDVAELTRKYDKGNDELVANMANAEVAVINIDAEVARAQTRATAMLGTLTKASSVSVGSGSGDMTNTGAGAQANTADSAVEMARRQAEDILAAAKEAQMTEREQLRAHLEAEMALLEQFGMDTTPLLVNYMKRDAELLQEEYDAMEAEARDWMNEMGNILEADIEFELPEQVAEMLDNFEVQMQRMQNLVDDFSGSVVAGFTDACQEMMDQLFGLGEVNIGSVVSALLTPLADMAIRAGEIIMAEGIATKLANEALKDFGESGAAAAAAGAALIVAGTAAKAGLSALANRGSAPTATTSYGSAASGGSAAPVEAMELTVHVDGKIQGADIVLSGSKTTNEWGK